MTRRRLLSAIAGLAAAAGLSRLCRGGVPAKSPPPPGPSDGRAWPSVDRVEFVSATADGRAIVRVYYRVFRADPATGVVAWMSGVRSAGDWIITMPPPGREA